MPCKAIQKFKVKKGDILICGWLPPVLVNADGDICTSGVVPYGAKPVLLAQKLLVGGVTVGLFALAFAW